MPPTARAHSLGRARGPHLAAAVLALLTPARVAAAQESDQELARQAFQRGVEALQARRYSTAIVELELSYSLVPRCSTQFNLGVAFEQTGRHADGLDLFERYERECGASMSPQNATYLRTALPQLRRRVGLVVLRVTPASAVAAVSIDRRARPQWLGEIPLDAGPHAIEVRGRDGRTVRREVTVSVGARETVDIALAERPVEPTPPPTLPLAPDPYATEVARPTAAREGRLRVESSVEGASIWIDGREVGESPVEQSLSSGRHVVEVRADGHRSARWSMSVLDGSVTRLAARLDRDDEARETSTPFYTRWWFWTIIGAAAVGGAVALTWELTRPNDSLVYTFEALRAR